MNTSIGFTTSVLTANNNLIEQEVGEGECWQVLTCSDLSIGR